jgi:hypothetical protein
VGGCKGGPSRRAVAERALGRAMTQRLLLCLPPRPLPGFAGRILTVDLTASKRAPQTHVPDRRPIDDGLIAGTALVLGISWRRQGDDFQPVAVAVIDRGTSYRAGRRLVSSPFTAFDKPSRSWDTRRARSLCRRG